MIVAACPGGCLSNVVTHRGGGNTALSVSISAVASLLALLLTPFNFTWMIGTNPATASWMRAGARSLRHLAQPRALLALPMALGLLFGHRLAGADREDPEAAGHLQSRRAAGLHRARRDARAHLLNAQILPRFGLVVLHNAVGLAFGWLAPWRCASPSAIAAPS